MSNISDPSSDDDDDENPRTGLSSHTPPPPPAPPAAYTPLSRPPSRHRSTGDDVRIPHPSPRLSNVMAQESNMSYISSDADTNSTVFANLYNRSGTMTSSSPMAPRLQLPNPSGRLSQESRTSDTTTESAQSPSIFSRVTSGISPTTIQEYPRIGAGEREEKQEHKILRRKSSRPIGAVTERVRSEEEQILSRKPRPEELADMKRLRSENHSYS